jgi:hypothetical protein
VEGPVPPQPAQEGPPPIWHSATTCRHVHCSPRTGSPVIVVGPQTNQIGGGGDAEGSVTRGRSFIRSRIGLSSMGRSRGSPCILAEIAEAGHDRRAADHGQRLVPLEIPDPAPAEPLEERDGLGPVRNPEALAEEPVHGQVEAGEPGQVVLGRTDRGHVPVEDRQRSEVVPEHHVLEAGVAPQECRIRLGGRTMDRHQSQRVDQGSATGLWPRSTRSGSRSQNSTSAALSRRGTSGAAPASARWMSARVAMKLR